MEFQLGCLQKKAIIITFPIIIIKNEKQLERLAQSALIFHSSALTNRCTCRHLLGRLMPIHLDYECEQGQQLPLKEHSSIFQPTLCPPLRHRLPPSIIPNMLPWKRKDIRDHYTLTTTTMMNFKAE